MPRRARDIIRAVRDLGIELVPPSKGSHYKFVRGSTVYPIPLHNGEKTEIDDKYINGLCRAFGIDKKALLAAA